MANGSEAPSEFTFYFPDLKALCLSEVVTAHMHNVYTLRGAKVIMIILLCLIRQMRKSVCLVALICSIPIIMLLCGKKWRVMIFPKHIPICTVRHIIR